MTKYYIYKIVDCYYVGSTKDIKKRYQSHKHYKYNINDERGQLPLYVYMRENDISINLEIIDVIEGTQEDAYKKEQEWIDKLNTLQCGNNSKCAYKSREDKLLYGRLYMRLKRSDESFLVKQKEYNKEYYHKNQKREQERAKQYYKDNIDKVTLRKRKKVICPICHKEHSHDSTARHNRRNHLIHPPTETREEYIERIQKEKEEKARIRKEKKKILNAERKNKPKKKCDVCNKILAYSSWHNHIRVCHKIT